MGLKQWLFGHEVARTAEDAKMGKLGSGAKAAWNFLDGWKSWIVACVAVYKLWCHGCATSGYADSALNAVGWNGVTGAFDPQQALMAFGVLVALGHRLVKAVRQYRAGVPIQDLNSEKKAV